MTVLSPGFGFIGGLFRALILLEMLCCWRRCFSFFFCRYSCYLQLTFCASLRFRRSRIFRDKNMRRFSDRAQIWRLRRLLPDRRVNSSTSTLRGNTAAHRATQAIMPIPVIIWLFHMNNSLRQHTYHKPVQKAT